MPHGEVGRLAYLFLPFDAGERGPDQGPMNRTFFYRHRRRIINIGLDSIPMERCPALDADPDHRGTINEIILAVYYLLNGCPRTCAAP